jgi:hypothetical protein
MLRISITTVVLILSVCLCVPADAQEQPAPGQVSSLQLYYCYLPSKYTKSRQWPVLYCFSSDGNAKPFIDKLFKDVCEKHGWIVIAAKGGPNPAAAKRVWDDSHKRFSINDKRCYSSGFSAGSGVAFIMAEQYSEHFAGVIPMAMANTWARKTPDLPKHVAVYFIMGSSDSVGAVKGHSRKLQANGNKTFVKVFQGGHRPPPKDVAEGAVEWLEQLAPRSGSKKVASTDRPTRVKLREDVSKKLKSAVQKAARGYLGSALKLARKVIDDDKADEQEKKDAAYIKEEIEKRLKELLAQADSLLKEKKPYEARTLLTQTSKAFNGTDEGRKVKQKIKEIDSDDALKDELAAGKIFARAEGYEAKGKDALAKKYFKQVADKYPETEYAKRAEEKLEP